MPGIFLSIIIIIIHYIAQYQFNVKFEDAYNLDGRNLVLKFILCTKDEQWKDFQKNVRLVVYYL